MRRLLACLLVAPSLFLLSFSAVATGQEKSVKPGINDQFKNPDVESFQKKFEVESREVYSDRKEVIAACKIKPGMAVADVGAGTGLFTRLFAREVGPRGKVFAVDISENFLDHIKKTCREQDLNNVTTVKGTDVSTELPANSCDLVFICDTYHHFEYPYRTMASIHKALKPGGRLIVIDFHRIPGKSREFILGHVRAGQEVFEREIVDSGFKKVGEEKDLLKENYFVRFEKTAVPQEKPDGTMGATPVVEGYGRVHKVAGDDPPRKGMKVVFDVTATAKAEGQSNPGLERVAAYYNLAGLYGVKPGELEVAVVLHGDATKSSLTDSGYTANFKNVNPDTILVSRLVKAGAKISVCGQSLHKHNLDPAQVRSDVKIAVSAMTAVINRQADGFAYVPNR